MGTPPGAYHKPAPIKVKLYRNFLSFLAETALTLEAIDRKMVSMEIVMTRRVASPGELPTDARGEDR
jgi:hypothetical protein